MMMRNSLRLLALGAALACTGLAAQETQKTWSAGASCTVALDSLKNVTYNTYGYDVDFGYNGHLGNTTVPFRASVGYQYFPGTTNAGLRQSLTSYQLAGDIFVASPWKDVQFITGLSVNRYKQENETATAKTKDNIKGTKLGARLGVEFGITPSWSAQVLLQLTEMGTNANQSSGINPSWVQAGVKYHF